MTYLEKKDLFSLEKYSEIRIAFRDKIIQHSPQESMTNGVIQMMKRTIIILNPTRLMTM